MVEYPSGRPKFFANRAIRLMVKTCIAQEIGPVGFSLLVVIANTEDAAGYRRAVTWYDGQLLPIVGVASQKSLSIARDKAIKAGWLHYEHGRKGVASKYWITIPSHCEGQDDGQTDEGQVVATEQDTEMTRKKDDESAANQRRISDESATNSHRISDEPSSQRGSFLPSSVPGSVPKEKEGVFFPQENTSEGTPEGDRLTMPGGLNDWSKQFCAAYVKKVDRNEIPAALDAAIIDVVTERSIDDQRAFAFILEAAVEFTNSPIGKSPLEKLPSPARWLKAGRYWDDRKLWQTPLGETAKPRDPPRPKVAPLVGDQLMAKFGGAK